jgi:hypothetical protein
MDRRSFLHVSAAVTAGLLMGGTGTTQSSAPGRRGVTLSGRRLTRPLAITMWDFSWLERRWPGAGYENWDLALDELKARGYDAVRIDAYPHLIAAGAEREWELLPCWNQHDWGSPARCRVRVQPALNEFIAKCARRGIVVGLSTWFREDTENVRMKIGSPEALGRVWKAALDSIPPSLRRHILYVDFCNEFPLRDFAPFLPTGFRRASPEGERWMRESIAVARRAHPQFSYTFSFTSEYDTWNKQDVSFLDFLEPHLWMTHFSDFYQQVGYKYEAFDPVGYEKIAAKAEPLYRSKPAHWQSRLEHGINFLAEWSRVSGKPLITTECWAVVCYKDWPLLNWDWVKELCELGVRRASATGRWAAIATSNFCGPQFRGMWRDVAWHRRLTDIIHRGQLPA